MFYITIISIISFYFLYKYSYLTDYKDILLYTLILVIVFFTPKQ